MVWEQDVVVICNLTKLSDMGLVRKRLFKSGFLF